jgi:hypothetical protein
MSSRVVAKANLLNQNRRAGSGLVYSCCVTTTALRYGDIRIFSIPLVDSRVVAEAMLVQIDGAAISALANISAVTEAALADGNI